MKTTTCTMIAAAAALLAGCQGSPEPAAPPTSQDALATTADPAPTTDAVPDDVAETSAPNPAEVTSEAGGAPEMPEEANEDSESGAEAFALHYLDVLNYSATTPKTGLLAPLVQDDCETCDGFESMVSTYVEQQQRAAGPIVTVESSRAQRTGETTVVFAEAIQTVPATLDSFGEVAIASASPTPFTMVLTVGHDGHEWRVSEIQVQQ